MAYSKDYADNFLKACEDNKLSEWADELQSISRIVSMDIEAASLEDVRAIAVTK